MFSDSYQMELPLGVQDSRVDPDSEMCGIIDYSRRYEYICIKKPHMKESDLGRAAFNSRGEAHPGDRHHFVRRYPDSDR